jgi:hypothetical protein
MGQCYIYTANS